MNTYLTLGVGVLKTWGDKWYRVQGLGCTVGNITEYTFRNTSAPNMFPGMFLGNCPHLVTV